MLSVDRNNIINFSENITEVLKKLVDKLIPKIVDIVVSHLREEKLGSDSPEAQLAINTVLHNFDEFAGDILNQLSVTEYDSLKLDKVSIANQKNIFLGELFSCPDITFENIDIRQLDDISRQIVFGKAFAAEAIEVVDENIKIKSERFFPPSYALKEDRTLLHHVQYVLKADKWEGRFKQYDLVTSLWPVVPESLFEKIAELERQDNYSLDKRRIKIISQTGNGLYGMGAIEPALVNPRIGISSYRKDDFGKAPCLIGRIENIQNHYSLFELNSFRKLVREENKDYVLFEYVAPREIAEEDEIKLKDYIGKDDTYIQGVKEGWSILFLGYECTYYILPGVHKREELVELIPASIRTKKSGIEYYNLDGTKLKL